MCFCKLITIYTLLFFSSIIYCTAQVSVEEILKINQIPLLGTLIDSALARSPMRNYHLSREAEAYSNLKSTKREVLNHMGLESYYRYGQLGVIGVNNTTEDPNQDNTESLGGITTYNTQRQNLWYVGAYVRIPILSIVDRNNSVRKMKHSVSQSQYEVDNATEQTIITVIDEYNRLLLNLESLIVTAKLIELNNIQIKESEHEYKQGKISLSSLAQFQEMLSGSMMDYAKYRSECRIAVLKLQQITGIKLTLSTQYQ